VATGAAAAAGCTVDVGADVVGVDGAALCVVGAEGVLVGAEGTAAATVDVADEMVCVTGGVADVLGVGAPVRSARATSANVAKPTTTAAQARTLVRPTGSRSDIQTGCCQFQKRINLSENQSCQGKTAICGPLLRPRRPRPPQVRRLEADTRPGSRRRGSVRLHTPSAPSRAPALSHDGRGSTSSTCRETGTGALRHRVVQWAHLGSNQGPPACEVCSIR